MNSVLDATSEHVTKFLFGIYDIHSILHHIVFIIIVIYYVYIESSLPYFNFFPFSLFGPIACLGQQPFVFFRFTSLTIITISLLF